MKERALLVLGVLGQLSVGCGGGEDGPPAIKGTLHIRSLVALTGATSDNGKEYYQGIKDAVREANERPGGVAGWRIRGAGLRPRLHAAQLDGQIRRVEGRTRAGRRC